MSQNGHFFERATNSNYPLACGKCGRVEEAHPQRISGNGHIGPLVADALRAEAGPAPVTTDPVPRIVGEPVALRRMREAQALGARLDREAATEKAGGPERSQW